MRRVLAIVMPIVFVACVAAPSGSPAPTSAVTEPTDAATPTNVPLVTASPPAEPAPSSTSLPEPTPPSTPLPATRVPPSPTPEPSLPPPFGPALLATSGEPVPNSDLGGCGSLWYGADVWGSDDCGPHAFDLDADPVVVAPGGTMTFTPPSGWLFSIDRISSNPGAAGFHAWSISIALVSDLADLPLGEQERITADHGGRTLGYGDREVISAWVKAPVATGEYLVELDASANFGPWTQTWPEFFWRVSVR